MSAIHFTVTSTAKNAAQWAKRCVASVHAQAYPNWKHIYVAADHATGRAAQGDYPTRLMAAAFDLLVLYSDAPSLANLWPIWQSLPDDEVIVWLDGDDWLADDFALSTLKQYYESEFAPWLTYGQFRFTNAPPGFSSTRGFAAPYESNENVRTAPWRATHLKTFRAGLVKRIAEDDLKKPDGSWCDFCTDHVIMLPLMEMAGIDRCLFIPNTLSVYNYEASYGATHVDDPAALAVEEAERARLCALPSYKRLEMRPW